MDAEVEKQQQAEATEQYTLRIPSRLRQDLERIALASDRSLSRQIINVLRHFVDDQGLGPKE